MALPEIWTFNSILAVLGFFACLAAATVMNGTTSHVMRASLVLIALGLLGQGIGTQVGQWESCFDTLLFGGILAWLIGSRRMPAVFQQRYGTPLAWAAIVSSGGVGFFSLFVIV